MNSEFMALLQQMIAQRYICVQRHLTEDLHIYNYTQKAQYERVWNEATLQCRGLILNGAGAVVARPFPKFFNVEEVEALPVEPFEVYDKMDGSLGILYWIGNEAFMATRGSFDSEQSRRANQMLQSRYAAALPHLQRDRTYLFEIIYPENRVVVDYGRQEALVLLAVIDTTTGKDLPLESVGFPVVERFDGITDLNAIRERAADNKEGFVIKFESGYRVKAKFTEYVRLHRIITRVSSRQIWEYLRTGASLEEMLEQVPDEFYQWVRETEGQLRAEYATIEQAVRQHYASLVEQLGENFSRRDFAELANQYRHPHLLFGLLDGKSLAERIWKLLEPAFEKPFRTDTEH